jgi:hypothetical protein
MISRSRRRSCTARMRISRRRVRRKGRRSRRMARIREMKWRARRIEVRRCSKFLEWMIGLRASCLLSRNCVWRG